MGKFKDLTGQTINSWKILYRNGYASNKAIVWRCLCLGCNREYDVVGTTITSGRSRMCLPCSISISHTKPFSKDKIKVVFSGMKERCYNENNSDYKYYKDKGIDEKWLNNPQLFYEWAYANGYKEGLTIDRIDGTKGYSEDNCRFVTVKEQNRNKSNNIFITKDGVTKTLQEWCDQYGFCRSTISSRVKKKGISYEESLQIEIDKSTTKKKK